MKESPKAMDKREVVYKYLEMPITQHWHLWKQMEWTPVAGTEQERDKAFFKWVKENNKTSQLMTLLEIETNSQNNGQ